MSYETPVAYSLASAGSLGELATSSSDTTVNNPVYDMATMEDDTYDSRTLEAAAAGDGGYVSVKGDEGYLAVQPET